MPIERLQEIRPRIMDDLPVFSSRLEDLPEGYHITDLEYDASSLEFLGPLMPTLLDIAENHYKSYEVAGQTCMQQLQFMQSSLDENIGWLEKVAENSVKVFIDTGRSKTIFQNANINRDMTRDLSNVENILETQDRVTDNKEDAEEINNSMEQQTVKKGISQTSTLEIDETDNENNYKIQETSKGVDSTINVKTQKESGSKTIAEDTSNALSDLKTTLEPIINTTETVTDNNRQKSISESGTKTTEPNPDNGNASNTTTNNNTVNNYLNGLDGSNVSQPQNTVVTTNTTTETPHVKVKETDSKNSTETLSGGSTTTLQKTHVSEGVVSTINNEVNDKNISESSTNSIDSSNNDNATHEQVVTKESIIPIEKTKTGTQTTTVEYNDGADAENNTKLSNNISNKNGLYKENSTSAEQVTGKETGTVSSYENNNHLYSELLSRYSNDSSIVQMRDFLKHFPNITGLFVNIFSKDFVIYNSFF